MISKIKGISWAYGHLNHHQSSNQRRDKHIQAYIYILALMKIFTKTGKFGENSHFDLKLGESNSQPKSVLQMNAMGWCELAFSISNQRKEEMLNLKALGAYLSILGKGEAWKGRWLESWRLQEEKVKSGRRERDFGGRRRQGGSKEMREWELERVKWERGEMRGSLDIDRV